MRLPRVADSGRYDPRVFLLNQRHPPPHRGNYFAPVVPHACYRERGCLVAGHSTQPWRSRVWVCVAGLLECVWTGSGGVGSTGGKGGTALAIIANASATTTVAILGSIVVNGGVGAVSGTCGGGGAGTWPRPANPTCPGIARARHSLTVPASGGAWPLCTGGSVAINASIILGTGSISAKGGLGGSASCSSIGGAGRCVQQSCSVPAGTLCFHP